MCGIVVEHRDGEVLSIKPNRDDVLSRGHICPKAVALKDLHEDPDRLRTPLRRTASGWEEISWAAAFDEIERASAAIRAQHGNDAVAIYAGNPTVHNLGAMLGIGDFIRALRTQNLYSATSVDQLPHMVASWAMFGHQFLMPVPDVDRTQLFVCIGGNPVASGGSIMGAPGFEKRIEALQCAGRALRRRRSAAHRIGGDRRRVPAASVPAPTSTCCSRCCTKCSRRGASTWRTSRRTSTGSRRCAQAVLGFDPAELAARTSLPHSRIIALAHDTAAPSRARWSTGASARARRSSAASRCG